ncbi:MAG TPA: Fur family transcriptional regulator [Candidatus Omnitrophota bacterium]|nr:Fur family transcriptional regulator [Candidatus Omnitrophota bacterium]HPD84548.1 Fur family transcriptional regulator [Candidatus Omnitrophota bacterium]HRZ03406.1 Fur family transcriptional regulator [Candidatus Omnitrophota bacterium]
MISVCKERDISPYLEQLKEQGLKVTPKRRAVIDLFLREGKCLGPHEIHTLLKKKSLSAGLPTVYRILDELSGIGILTRIEKESRQFYYALCRAPEGDHHHFICRKCKKVEEVEYCNFKEVAEFISKKLRGKVESHFIRIEGLCAQCR